MSGQRDPISALSSYWSGLAQGQAPERALFSPRAITPLLPLVLLAEFEHDPFRVRYRLTGTLVDRWNGINITGRYLDELTDQGGHGAIAMLQAGYQQCCESAEPVIGAYDWSDRHGGVLKVRFGLFPLRLNGVVAQCLAIEDYSALPHSYEGPMLRR